MQTRKRPLEGIRVLDIATLVAGPFSAASMAEFGAEVIKIEKPGSGDTLRKLGTEATQGDTYWWLSDGRNKRCVTLDLRQPAGSEIFKKLVAISDVVIENFRPGTLEQWGLGYDELSRLNPGIILLRVSGYGQSGPNATMAGVARIAEGYAGISYLTGDPDGPPLLSGASAMADYVTGLYGAYGIMLALRERDQSGAGQVIDVALYDGLVRFLDELVPHFSKTGIVRERMGAETFRSVPHSNYPTRDGHWVSIACTNDSMFGRLANAMERADLATHANYADNADRITNRAALNEIVETWTRSLDLAEIVARCKKASVPCGPVMNIRDIMEDPHHNARGSFKWMHDQRVGDIAVSATVPRLSATPGDVRHLGKALGVDNAAIFLDLLKLDESFVQDLKAREVI